MGGGERARAGPGGWVERSWSPVRRTGTKWTPEGPDPAVAGARPKENIGCEGEAFLGGLVKMMLNFGA